MRQLLAFGRFADDSQGILAAVQRLANMSIKLRVDRLHRIFYGELFPARDLELLVATEANPQVRSAPYPFHNSQFSFWHASIISCPFKAVSSVHACANETAPVPNQPAG